MQKTKGIKAIVTALLLVLFIFSTVLWGQTSGKSVLEMMRKSKGKADKPAYMDRSKKKAEEAPAEDANSQPKKDDPFSKYKKTKIDISKYLTDANETKTKPAEIIPVKPRKKIVKKPTADKLLNIIPANSVLVIRGNHLEYNVNKLDQYLSGVSPLPMGLSMMLRAQLAGAFGDPELKTVKMNSNFAIFITAPENNSSEFSFDDMFIGFLIPVTYYKKFISDNPNVSEPDEYGVSRILENLYSIRVGKYALITPAQRFSSRLPEIARSMNDKKTTKLASILTDVQIKQATKEPFWALLFWKSF